MFQSINLRNPFSHSVGPFNASPRKNPFRNSVNTIPTQRLTYISKAEVKQQREKRYNSQMTSQRLISKIQREQMLKMHQSQVLRLTQKYLAPKPRQQTVKKPASFSKNLLQNLIRKYRQPNSHLQRIPLAFAYRPQVIQIRPLKAKYQAAVKYFQTKYGKRQPVRPISWRGTRGPIQSNQMMKKSQMLNTFNNQELFLRNQHNFRLGGRRKPQTAFKKSRITDSLSAIRTPYKSFRQKYSSPSPKKSPNLPQTIEIQLKKFTIRQKLESFRKQLRKQRRIFESVETDIQDARSKSMLADMRRVRQYSSEIQKKKTQGIDGRKKFQEFLVVKKVRKYNLNEKRKGRKDTKYKFKLKKKLDFSGLQKIEEQNLLEQITSEL